MPILGKECINGQQQMRVMEKDFLGEELKVLDRQSPGKSAMW